MVQFQIHLITGKMVLNTSCYNNFQGNMSLQKKACLLLHTFLVGDILKFFKFTLLSMFVSGDMCAIGTVSLVLY